ncbi:MAG: DNA mismatch repair protein MutS [Chitinophagaceae bacterium]|jgi:DNA mismatch repair protein MutS2|nr:DNA mismatch repair protein MutS [Chitinophagaceae bacterium]
MKFFPDSALVQLELDKIKALLLAHCKTEYAKNKAADLRIHTKKEYIQLQLQQSYEMKLLQEQGQYFPNDYILNLSRELKLLSIPGAVLGEEQIVLLRKLAENTQSIFRWFDADRRMAYKALTEVIEGTYYEKVILELINDVLDDGGVVKDDASEELSSIRMNLYRKRNELRREFDKVLKKLQKQGYVADIEESFLSGRRVVALFAEQKRQVKGILHGESETRRTVFVEPEETIELNNDIFSLENEERREVYRILRDLTQQLSVYASLLTTYHNILGEFDFIRAKAKLGVDMQANLPVITDKAVIYLKDAFHPLLLLYNKKNNKPTIPTHIRLDEKSRILVISGPNAGGKTVTLKTVGLMQLMVQCGLLVPVHPDSEFGLFKQIMIHIGDTQSIEYDLSTYSSHLMHMKHFMETANGRTLFFIDELGSGSDPNLGGAFAEVILQELVKKHSLGIVTTHYLNLKVMANHTPGIINGAMSFDEKSLQPLYKLIIGKPGSSYTFAIAERIGLDKKLIERARQLVDEDHFRLDKLLNSAESDLRQIEKKEKELHRLLKENEKLKKEMEQVLNKEKHQQQVELLKQQNKITEDRITYLKDMDRKLKAIVQEWKRSDNKQEVMKQINALLFDQKQKQVAEKKDKKISEKFKEVGGEIKPGVKVKMMKNRQIGIVKELRGKNAVVQLGAIPITISLSDLVVVVDKVEE